MMKGKGVGIFRVLLKQWIMMSIVVKEEMSKKWLVKGLRDWRSRQG